MKHSNRTLIYNPTAQTLHKSCKTLNTVISDHVIFKWLYDSVARDTELAQLPVGLLNTLKLKQPQVVSRMIDIMGEKILSGYTRMSSSNPCQNNLWMEPSRYQFVVISSTVSTVTSSNLSTVAVVPVTADVPISHLTRELCSAIKAIGIFNF